MKPKNQNLCKCGKIEGNSWSLHRQECKKFEAQKLVPPKRTPKKPKNQTCKCGHVKKEHRNGEVFHIVGNVGVRISKCKKFETQLVPKEKITVGTKNHSPQTGTYKPETEKERSASVDTLSYNLLALRRYLPSNGQMNYWVGNNKKNKGIYVDLGAVMNWNKDFIQKVEEIVKRRCLGTSANCYEINKEIRKNAGDKLLK